MQQPYVYKSSNGKEYTLHSVVRPLKNVSRTVTLYFFTLAGKKREGALDTIPEGKKVVESPRTKLPILKKISG